MTAWLLLIAYLIAKGYVPMSLDILAYNRQTRDWRAAVMVARRR